MKILPTHGHQWLTSCPGCFNPGKEPRYPYIEDWVGPRADLDVLEKRKTFCSYQDLNQEHPASGTVTILTKIPCPKTNKKFLGK